MCVLSILLNHYSKAQYIKQTDEAKSDEVYESPFRHFLWGAVPILHCVACLFVLIYFDIN